MAAGACEAVHPPPTSAGARTPSARPAGAAAGAVLGTGGRVAAAPATTRLAAGWLESATAATATTATTTSTPTSTTWAGGRPGPPIRTALRRPGLGAPAGDAGADPMGAVWPVHWVPSHQRRPEAFHGSACQPGVGPGPVTEVQPPAGPASSGVVTP